MDRVYFYLNGLNPKYPIFLLYSYLTLILFIHATIKLDLLTTCCTIDYAKGRYQVIIITNAYR